MIYFLQRADGAIKIGTTKHFTLRLYQLRMDHGELALLGWVYGGRPEEVEMHKRFSAHRLGSQKEWFADCTEIRDYIRALAHKTPPPKVPTTVDVVLGDGDAEKIEHLHMILEQQGINTRNPRRHNCYSDTLLFRYLLHDKLRQLEEMPHESEVTK